MTRPLTDSSFIEPAWPAPASVLALSTSREGGHSVPPYAGFNLGQHVGDSESAVTANRNLLAGALPRRTTIQWLSQVHGARVVAAGQGDPYPQADASWSRQPGQACAVLTADCLPVLFCSAAGDAVAAAHAGWRGLLQGVLEATIAAMAVAPSQLLAWLGPAIGPAAFEVGPEVRSAYLASAAPEGRAAVAACFRPGEAAPGRYLADLYSLARLRLLEAGLDQVYGGEFCTVSDAGRFFSYRRDGQTGRMASLIMIKPG